MKKRYKKMSDAELLTIMEQDEEAFNELYERYYRLVYFIAYEMCHNDADAKDVMQETFIKVRKAAKNIRESDKFKYWLNAVTISKCKDLFKKNKYGNMEEHHPYARRMQQEERRYMLPEKQMHFNNDKQLLYRFIQRLPQSQREVLVLKYFSDLSLQEIASIMDISEGTVKSRLHYAKDGLRGMIENYNGKEKNHPLNFESIDILLPSVFAYAFQHAIPFPNMLFRYRPKITHQALVTTIGIATTAVCVSGGLWWLHKQDNPRTSQRQEPYADQTYRNAYFHLMDFAATPYDMEAKSYDQLREVYEEYALLKEANNAYYQLLVAQDWVLMYEEALKK